MTTIIVPTDFSDNAYNALFYASRLIPQAKCKILLVHSYEKELAQQLSIMDPSKNESIVKDLRVTIHNRLEEVEHKLLLDSKDVSLRVETFYGSNSLISMINELISSIDIHCVVMGTKGTSGLKEVFLGSQAVSVIKSVKPIPLFLISQNTDFRFPKNVVYATDFKRDYHQQHFGFLKLLIKNHDATLNVSHVYNPVETESGVEPHYKDLEKKLADIPFTMHWIANTKGVEEDMAQFCRDQDSDLLVLTYHRYGFFKNLVKTSYVEKASFHIDLPLLILPNTD